MQNHDEISLKFCICQDNSFPVYIFGLVPSDEQNGSKGIITGRHLRAHTFFVKFVSGTYVHTQTHPNPILQLAVDYHSHCHPAIYITHGVINHLLTSHDFQLKFPDADTVPNIVFPFLYRQWAPYQLRKIVDCACRECRERFPHHRLQRKLLVSDPGMHHGTCVTHVPWCMSGSLNCGGGENVPGIPGPCATRNFTYLARGPWQ